MTDIMKYIVNGGDTSDPEGYVAEIEAWSEAEANRRAQAQGLLLSKDHWEVIRFLRSQHEGRGQAPNARALLQSLEQKFASKGGRKWLYLLFPKGPVTQGCHISGVPVPVNHADPSFGTSL